MRRIDLIIFLVIMFSLMAAFGLAMDRALEQRHNASSINTVRPLDADAVTFVTLNESGRREASQGSGQ